MLSPGFFVAALMAGWHRLAELAGRSAQKAALDQAGRIPHRSGQNKTRRTDRHSYRPSGAATFRLEAKALMGEDRPLIERIDDDRAFSAAPLAEIVAHDNGNRLARIAAAPEGLLDNNRVLKLPARESQSNVAILPTTMPSLFSICQKKSRRRGCAARQDHRDPAPARSERNYDHRPAGAIYRSLPDC